MDNDLDQNEEYNNQARLDALKSEASKSNVNPGASVGSVAKNMAVDAAKKAASKKVKQIIINYVLPVILIGLGIYFLICFAYVLIASTCSKIPGAGLFSDMCKGVTISSDEKNVINSTYGIDGVINGLCSQNGGSYDAENNNCGYGY